MIIYSTIFRYKKIQKSCDRIDQVVIEGKLAACVQDTRPARINRTLTNTRNDRHRKFAISAYSQLIFYKRAAAKDKLLFVQVERSATTMGTSYRNGKKTGRLTRNVTTDHNNYRRVTEMPIAEQFRAFWIYEGNTSSAYFMSWKVQHAEIIYPNTQSITMGKPSHNPNMKKFEYQQNCGWQCFTVSTNQIRRRSRDMVSVLASLLNPHKA